MVKYRIVYTKKAVQDIPKLKQVGLEQKAKQLLSILENNPYQNPPSYEKLQGTLQGAYARRINIKHRLVYEILESEEDKRIIKVISLWSYYEI